MKFPSVASTVGDVGVLGKRRQNCPTDKWDGCSTIHCEFERRAEMCALSLQTPLEGVGY